VPQPIDIANRALIGIGSAPIQNFDDATPTASVVKAIYDDTVAWLLAFYPWSFTKSTVQLVQVNIPPDAVDGRIGAGWRYAFEIDSTAMGPPLACFRYPRVPLTPMKDFAIENQLLYSMWQNLYATFQYAVDPEQWSGPFVKAAVAVLGAEFLIPMSGNSGMLDVIQAKAWGAPQENRRGGFLGDAIKFDSRQQPSTALLETSDPLTDARWA
jgi:hypothetical protein